MSDTCSIFSHFFKLSDNAWCLDRFRLGSQWKLIAHEKLTCTYVQVSKFTRRPTNCQTQNPVQTTNVWTARRSMELSIGRAHFAENYIVAQNLRHQNAVPVTDFNGQPWSTTIKQAPPNHTQSYVSARQQVPCHNGRVPISWAQGSPIFSRLCTVYDSLVYLSSICWRNMNKCLICRSGEDHPKPKYAIHNGRKYETKTTRWIRVGALLHSHSISTTRRPKLLK